MVQVNGPKGPKGKKMKTAMYRNSRFAGAALLLVLITASNQAKSGTATANATIVASIGASCSVSPVTAATVNYDPVVLNATTPGAGQFNITYTCTVGSTPTMSLDEGLNKATGSTPVAPQRRMANGTALMNYNIFSSTTNRTTATPAVAWGTGNAPTLGTPTGTAQTVAAYIGIPAGQVTLTNGTYQDTVLITATF